MNREIVPDLDENIAYIEKRFEGCADAVMRRLWMGDEKLEIYVIYMDSMYDRDFVDGVLLKSLLFDVSWLPERHAGQAIFNKYLATADVKEISRLDDLMDEVLKGNTGILAAGMSKAIVVSTDDNWCQVQNGCGINVYGRSGSAFRSAGSAQSVGKL